MTVEGNKKANWAGIAALIAAVATVPGVLVNTYLDYKGRNTAELIQKSSHGNVSEAIGSIVDDVDECFEEVDELKRELSELRGFIKGRFGRAYERHEEKVERAPVAARSPSSKPEPTSVSDEMEEDKPSHVKSRRPASFDTIMEQVQSTGKVFQSQDQQQDEP